jgi:hypothetical protein
MFPQPSFLSVIRPNPSPYWYVTNGEVTVGPVETSLLRRGVAEGAIPEYCWVSASGGPWRPLDTVREVAKLHRPAVASAAPSVERPDRGIPIRSRDQDELCYHVTRLAMLVTGAESAMFHIRERDTRTLRTRCVLGSVSQERLNTELENDDLVFRFASVGRPVFCSPDTLSEDFGSIAGASEDALAERFETAGEMGGAAMIPVFLGHSLRAMLEVSRPGHAFRREDLQRAERIAQGTLHQRDN